MSIVQLLYIVSIVFALIEELQTNGRSLVGYAIILTDVGLLWGRLG